MKGIGVTCGVGPDTKGRRGTVESSADSVQIGKGVGYVDEWASNPMPEIGPQGDDRKVKRGR